MQDLKKYWSITVIVLVAVAATTIAGWVSVVKPELYLKESIGSAFWYLPGGILFLMWAINGTKKLNRPLVALSAVVAYALSILLLFAPALPPSFYWYYPIGIWFFVVSVFFS